MPTTRDILIAIFVRHVTSHTVAGAMWQWSCRCGKQAAFGSWAACRQRTLEHWADVIIHTMQAQPKPDIRKLIHAGVACSASESCEHPTLEDCIFAQFVKVAESNPMVLSAPKCDTVAVVDGVHKRCSKTHGHDGGCDLQPAPEA